MSSIEEPVLYVEGLFADSIAEQLGIKLVSPSDDWLARLPDDYRRREVAYMTLSEARTIKHSRFIKPAQDKVFPVGIYRGSELPSDISDDLPVLVAEPVEWESEFRCFVLDGKVRTISVYMRHGQVTLHEGFRAGEEELASAIEFAERVLQDSLVKSETAVVMDVGVIGGRGWSVVEQNPAWGSGIYGCLPESALQVIRRSCHR
jgi:hypothetical protein